MTVSTQRPGSDERARSLAMAVLLMTVMIGFAGFAVDLGWWYSRAIQIQRAADAAVARGRGLDARRRQGAHRGRSEPQDQRIRRRRRHLDHLHADSTPAVPGAVRTPRWRPTSAVWSWARTSTSTGPATARVSARHTPRQPLNHFGTRGDEHLRGGQRVLHVQGGRRPVPEPLRPGEDPARCPSTAPPPAGPGPNGTYVDNTEYRGQDGVLPGGGTAYKAGYSYYIDLPLVRSTTIRVALFDAAFFNNTASSPDNDYGGSGTVTTTYRLRKPDTTPLDDTDNPIVPASGGTTNCGGLANPRSFATNDATFGLTIASITRYTAFCTIPTSAPGGKYILDVFTTASQGNSVGANAYGIFLQKGTSSAVVRRTDRHGLPAGVRHEQHLGLCQPGLEHGHVLPGRDRPGVRGQDPRHRTVGPGRRRQHAQDPRSDGCRGDVQLDRVGWHVGLDQLARA